MQTDPPTPAATTLRWPLLMLLALGMMWGLHFSIIKIAAESGLSYPGIAATTTWGIAIMLTVICAARGKFPSIAPRALAFYPVCALLGYLIPFFVELNVAANIDAGLLSVIVTSAPIFTVIIALAARTEPVGRRAMTGVAVGFVAAAILLIPEAATPGSAMIGWMLFAFAVPLTYASYHNFVVKYWPENTDSWQLATGEALVAFCILTPIYIYNGDFISPIEDWSRGGWTIAVMVAFSALEIYLYFEIVRLSGAVYVSQANYIMVVAGVIWGMVIFSEQPTAWLWLSATVLIAALYLTQSEKSTAT